MVAPAKQSSVNPAIENDLNFVSSLQDKKIIQTISQAETSLFNFTQARKAVNQNGPYLFSETAQRHSIQQFYYLYNLIRPFR